MLRNVAGQKLTVFCFDSATNLPKSGDAGNLTAYVQKDDGTVTVLADTSATELDATNAKGLYVFDLAQGETDGDKLVFSGKSATSGVVVVPVTIYTLPQFWPNFAAAVAGIGFGTALVTGASTTSVPTSAFSHGIGAASQLVGKILQFRGDTTTTALRGAVTVITATTNSATPTFTVSPALPATPASGDLFVVQ